MKFLLIFVLALIGTSTGISKAHSNLPNLEYMVKLEVSKAGQCSVCSGSFIDTNWILTAAHCVHGMDSITVYLGPPFEGNCSTGYEINKKSIVIHQLFDEVDHFVYHYDIALIKFTKKTSCRPKKLVRFLNEKPHTKSSKNESVAVVRFSSSCGQSPASLSVHSMISDLVCRTDVMWIMDKIWCVPAIDYDGSCDDDTSSHLIMPSTDGKLIGFMTHPRGKDCGRSKGITSDVIFTDVYQFKSWIKNKIKPAVFSSKQSMVRLSISKKDKCLACSGSFVNPHWILTSADCVHDAKSVVVDVGRHFRSYCPMSYRATENDIIVHPSFRMEYTIFNILESVFYNIALIKFIEDTSCEQNWIVRLPMKNIQSESYFNALGHFIRFGGSCNTSSPTLTSELLRVAVDAYCWSKPLAKLGLETRTLKKDQMCISLANSKVSCMGDTGGHLFKRGTSELIGIMSYQPLESCGYGGYVTFSVISYYVDWIKSHWTEIE